MYIKEYKDIKCDYNSDYILVCGYENNNSERADILAEINTETNNVEYKHWYEEGTEENQEKTNSIINKVIKMLNDYKEACLRNTEIQAILENKTESYYTFGETRLLIEQNELQKHINGFELETGLKW